MKNTVRVIPEGAVMVEYPEAGAVVYLYTIPGYFVYKAFRGKQSKSFSHCSFRTESGRDDYLKGIIKAETNLQTWKNERKNAAHTLQVGDIVFNTWGYDQTNASFFQVVHVPSNKSAVVREIEAAVTSKGDTMSGQAHPLRDQFKKNSAEKLHRATGKESLNSGRDGAGSLNKWDGLPVSISWYA